MAWGITPKYCTEVLIKNQSRAYVLLIESINKLGWKLSYIGSNVIIAYSKISIYSISEEISIRFYNDRIIITSKCIGFQIYDWEKNSKNIARLLSECQLLSDISNEYIDIKYNEIIQKISQNEIVKLKAPFCIPIWNSRFFIPSKDFFVTPILVIINFLIFLIMLISGVNIMQPSSEILLIWGANFRPITLDGQWWRLLVSCFLHDGLLHLLINMVALLYIGLFLEPFLKPMRFALTYLIIGIIASLCSICVNDNVISTGASGAIFGIYGVFLATLTTNLIEKHARKAILTSIGIFLGYTLLGFFTGTSDNAAHIGGLLSGIFIGYSFYPSLKQPNKLKLKYLTDILLIVLAFFASFVIYNIIPNNLGLYLKKMKTFKCYENEALCIYKTNQNITKENQLYMIKEIGIYYWNKNIELLNDLEKLNLPEKVHNKNKRLIKYCELRIKSYNLLYKKINEKSNIYNGQIIEYNSQIEDIINDVNSVPP